MFHLFVICQKMAKISVYFSLHQSNTSTTGSLTVPTRVLVTAAYVSTTRWTLWLGRPVSASVWASTSSTCSFPASSRCGSTPSRCPTASERTAPSACSTSLIPETPTSPLETATRPPPSPRYPPWWTVTSAARRNFCWVEPVPLNPTWWLCPAKQVTAVVFKIIWNKKRKRGRRKKNRMCPIVQVMETS